MANSVFSQSHTGLNMAIVFKEILEEFGIEHKVSLTWKYHLLRSLTEYPRSLVWLPIITLELNLQYASVFFWVQRCSKNNYLGLIEWPAEIRTERWRMVDCEGAGWHVEGIVSSQFLMIHVLTAFCLFSTYLWPSIIASTHISPPICQILKDGTEVFSHGFPNLAAVIPAMDHINKDFTMKTQADSNTHPAIRYALTLAQKMLNWYYSLTDESEVYRIAMGKFHQHCFLNYDL